MKKTVSKANAAKKTAQDQMARENAKENISSKANVDESMDSSGSDHEQSQVQSPKAKTQSKQVGKPTTPTNISFQSRHSFESRIKKPKTMSRKAGLVFPVIRVLKNLKRGKYALKIQKGEHKITNNEFGYGLKRTFNFLRCCGLLGFSIGILGRRGRGNRRKRRS
jgi:flagellar biosynthesis component FlhA